MAIAHESASITAMPSCMMVSFPGIGASIMTRHGVLRGDVPRTTISPPISIMKFLTPFRSSICASRSQPKPLAMAEKLNCVYGVFFTIRLSELMWHLSIPT